MTFSASVLVFDKPEISALVEGGDDMAVTEDNKAHYVECMVEWLSTKRYESTQRIRKWNFHGCEFDVCRYEPMLGHMIRGFQRLLPPNLLDLFSVQEIQVVTVLFSA